MESGDFNGIDDDEMLAAVLEMSRQEARLSAPPPMEDEPTSSPDTGFGDADINDLAYHPDQLEGDTKPSTGIHHICMRCAYLFFLNVWLLMFSFCIDVLGSLDMTMDDNKENQTPESVQQQGELDWVQQYNLDQEREEQELQQALAQSLQEHVRPTNSSNNSSAQNGPPVE